MHLTPFTANPEERLKYELEKASEKYHIVGAWIAIIFDPIFGITDYINIPDSWHKVLVLRFAVSFITLTALLLRFRLRLPSFLIVFIPFLLISLQNAYTYSLIDIPQFTGHTLNYIALWIGAGMFILWRWQYSAIIIGCSAVANVIFFRMNHALTLQEALVNGALLLTVVAFFMIMLIQTRYRLTVANIKAKIALEESNAALEESNTALAEQKAIVESKNKNILDSIRYAERIQKALLPNSERLKPFFEDFFILFQPKDIVSGDFYWFAHKAEVQKTFIVAADCTGHGVPGAFMSTIGDSALNKIIHDKEIFDPGLILEELHKSVHEMLRQKETANRDGMDVALCVIDWPSLTLHYAGAMNPLYYIRHTEPQPELHQIKATKRPIGGLLFSEENERKFSTHSLSLTSPLTFYLFSDGYYDEIGGPEERKFTSKRFRELLTSINHLSMAQQKQVLEQTMQEWLKNSRQLDDILVLGIRVG